MQQLRDRDDCPNEAREQLKAALVGEWGVPLEAPKTNAERSLTGCLLTEDDIEILYVIDGGGFGRILKIRLKSDPRIHAAMKTQRFTMSDLKTYLAREIVDGTKVKSRHLLRALGIIPITSVINLAKPFLHGADSRRVPLQLEKCRPSSPR